MSSTSCAAIEANVSVLSASQLDICRRLANCYQGHLFSSWTPPGTHDDEKRHLAQQLLELDATYPGGLTTYISNARNLLERSRMEVNPFDGFVPEVPTGGKLRPFTEVWNIHESLGLGAASRTVFVLVAGGLGERLGYGGIKIELPSELTTGTLFVELYVSFLLAIGQRCGGIEHTPPLVIMTSDDTDCKTRYLLKKHSNFGLPESKLTIVKQGKVPALLNNDAHFATEPGNPFCVVTKPHGHGDVHSLVYPLLPGFEKKGFEWVVFFQDTNALFPHSILPGLGWSVDGRLHMNSMCVPRVAKEAVGAIARLKHTGSGQCITVNVEYNQLDPLLRATISSVGDVNDPVDNLSPFPGNINQLILCLTPYLKHLSKTHGAIPEFVNPKYADSERQVFKAPARLESMMQDYPLGLPAEEEIGFCTFDKWIAFSPVKNDLVSGASKDPPGTASSGEADVYKAHARKLALSGCCEVEMAPIQNIAGQLLSLGPKIVISPSTALTLADIETIFKRDSGNSISSRSTLWLSGRVSSIRGLKLDGALIVNVAPGSEAVIDNLTINNAGHEFVLLETNDKSVPESLQIRGWRLVKHAEHSVVIDSSGVTKLSGAF